MERKEGGREDGGEGREVNGASLSETMTSHRWQTIGQPVAFQQAAKTREKRGGRETRRDPSNAY